jgi:hypothetical protein
LVCAVVSAVTARLHAIVMSYVVVYLLRVSGILEIVLVMDSIGNLLVRMSLRPSFMVLMMNPLSDLLEIHTLQMCPTNVPLYFVWLHPSLHIPVLLSASPFSVALLK